LVVDWPVSGRLLTFTVPIKVVVPGVSVVETAGDLVADAVGSTRRMLAKIISSTRIFFMKNCAVIGFGYNISGSN
jgi:hypothetical protein